MEEYKLLSALNRLHLGVIVNKVMADLIDLDDKDYLLSGSDSPLKNVWEEICVQVQTEYSYHWSAYESTIENCIEVVYSKQPEAIRDLINYFGQLNSNDFTNDDIYTDEDGKEEIKSQILTLAADYNNATIYAYINAEEPDEEDEDEIEEDNEKENDLFS